MNTPAPSAPRQAPRPPSATRRRSPRALGPARWWTAALVTAPTAALFVLGYRRRWICDDGLIYLRPVRQIVAGHGPVFNVGERAESATGAIWQWLLALVTWVTGADPAFLAVGMGLALSTAGYALALYATCRAYELRRSPRAPAARPGAGRTTRALLPAGILVLLPVPPVWSYMTSGLESGLGTCWIGLAWWLLVRTRRGQPARAQSGTAFVLGLSWLVRPDLALAGCCFLAVQGWVLRPSPARALRLLGAAALVPAAYEVFRAGYYGVLVPSPAIAKEAGASDWGRGARYVQETLGPYWLWPALAILAVMAGRLLLAPRPVRRDGFGGHGEPGGPGGRGGRGGHRLPVLVFLAPPLAGALLALYVMEVGGDYMHARMILPALSLLLLPVLVVPASRVTTAGCGLLLVWLAAAASPLRQPFEPQGSAGTFNVRSSDVRYTHDHNPVRSATWVRHWPRLPHANAMLARAVHGGRPTLLYFDDRRQLHATPVRGGAPYPVVMVGRHLGVTGAAVPLDGYVNDAWGLASPLGAHLALGRGAWPGHEKFLRNEWIFADWAVAQPPSADLRLAGTDRAAVRDARKALGCGALAELTESVRDPLTADRFWRNLTGAYERTRFRFARQPRQAAAQLCGG